MSTYGYQTARNTYGLPASAKPATAPYSLNAQSGPYGGQTAKNTTLVPTMKPVSAPVSPYGGQTKKNTTNYPTATAPPSSAPPVVTGGTPPTSSPSTAPVAPSSTTYDYTTDPILQQVQAQAAQQAADAQAASLAQQKQLAIQYGDVDLANTLGDSATSTAAAQNPYSIYGQLTHQQPIDEQALDENLNKGNLYYSGARVNQQSDLANQYGVTRANDATQEQSALQQIRSALLAAQLSSQQSVSQAQSDAYNRFLQQLLANPPSGAATSSGSTSQGGGDGSGLSETSPDGDYTFYAPVGGIDNGYIPDGTVTGPNTIKTAGGGTYKSGGGTVTYQSGQGKYGSKPLL